MFIIFSRARPSNNLTPIPYKMKKVLMTFACACGIFVAQAQTKVEISAGIGTASAYGLADGIFSSIGNAVIGKDPISNTAVGNFGVAFYNKNERLRYGLDVVYHFFDKGDVSGISLTGKRLFFIPKADYFWMPTTSSFRLYSGIGLGLGIKAFKEENNSTSINNNGAIVGWNITPIGFRYGKDFAVFGEFNIGAKGWLQGGVSYRF